jgi:hypothetical protein
MPSVSKFKKEKINGDWYKLKYKSYENWWSEEELLPASIINEIKITDPYSKFSEGDEVFYSRMSKYPNERSKKLTVVSTVPDYEYIPSDELRYIPPYEGYNRDTPGPFYKVAEDYFGHAMYKWLSGNHLTIWPLNK